jgi:hypothetical protein
MGEGVAPLPPAFVPVIRVDAERAAVAQGGQCGVLADDLMEQGQAVAVALGVHHESEVVFGLGGMVGRRGNLDAGGAHAVELVDPAVDARGVHVELLIRRGVDVLAGRDGVLPEIGDGDVLVGVAHLHLEGGGEALPEREGGLEVGQGIGAGEVVGVAHGLLWGRRG